MTDTCITMDELDALHGRSWLAQLIYMRAIRPFMDFATGIVGHRRRISYRSITEELERDHRRGRHRHLTGLPTRKEIRCALEELERDLDTDLPLDAQRPALIAKRPADRSLVFFCPLAKRDLTGSDMRGRRQADDHTQSKGTSKPAPQQAFSEETGRAESDSNEPMRGTHPVSGSCTATPEPTSAPIPAKARRRRADNQSEQQNLALVGLLDGGAELIWPKEISQSQRNNLLRRLQPLSAEQRQSVIDTLAVRQRDGQIKSSLLGYASALVKQVLAGLFDPSIGEQLRAERVQIEQRQQADRRTKALAQYSQQQTMVEMARLSSIDDGDSIQRRTASRTVDIRQQVMNLRRALLSQK